MTQGLILAGGTSSRLLKDKMTLKIDELELICHTVKAMEDFVEGILVVTGYYHEDILDALRDHPEVLVVRNRFYERGMFSSIQYGARFLAKGDFFIHPGDIPFVRKSTFQKLLEAQGPVRIPVFHGECGHPIFFAGECLPSLLGEDRSSNLEVFSHKFPITLVEVDDEGVLLDVDTSEDFEHLKSYHERMTTDED